jgi:hypothetical protein
MAGLMVPLRHRQQPDEQEVLVWKRVGFIETIICLTIYIFMKSSCTSTGVPPVVEDVSHGSHYLVTWVALIGHMGDAQLVQAGCDHHVWPTRLCGVTHPY